MTTKNLLRETLRKPRPQKRKSGERLQSQASAYTEVAGSGLIPSSAGPSIAKRFERLQSLRFLLAALVVIHHGFNFAHIQRGWPDAAWPFDRFGQIGVIGFFVLSGYVVTMTLFNSTPGNFLLRRALRIYPAFWASIALVVAMKILFWGSFPFAAYQWSVLALLPLGKLGSPISVEWSLIYEVFYYALFGLIALAGLKRWLTPFLFGWIGISVIANALDPGTTTMFPYPRDILVSIFNVSFALGALTWLHREKLVCFQRQARGMGTLIIMAGMALFLLCAANWIAFCGLSLAAAYAIHVMAEDNRPLGPMGSSLARLGDGSYGLYLIHAPVLTICFAFFNGPAYRDSLSVLTAAIFVALVVGSLWGCLEYAAYGRISRWLSARRR